MYQIYSQIKGKHKQLLHTIIRKNDFKTINKRLDVSFDTEPLQLALINQNIPKKYASHIHIKNKKITNITQESWVIISGCVLVKLYDLDNTELYKTNLYPGDITITYYGGHGYEILANNTFVAEFKTGPYFGAEKDKKYIDSKNNIDYNFINFDDINN